jgi:hypothetical protein
MNVARTGRKPAGPQIVQRLEGSQSAKARLAVILETITGQLTVAQACAKLGIGESRFHTLRNETLQATLESLEPRPLGRPSRSVNTGSVEVRRLTKQLEQTRMDLEVAELQLSLARIHPGLIAGHAPADKKNAQRDRHQRKPQRSRKRQYKSHA